MRRLLACMNAGLRGPGSPCCRDAVPRIGSDRIEDEGGGGRPAQG